MVGIEVDELTALHLLEERHAEELFALIEANRGMLREWLPWLDRVREAADTRAFIRSVLGQLAEGTGLRTGLFHSGRIAGVVGLYSIDRPNRATTLAYWLGAEFQGRGLMTRAVAALLDHVFGEMGLHRAEIRVATGNSKSRTIPAKLGFAQEGVLRQREWLYDRFVDHVVYGMLVGEWSGGRGPSRG